jgi:hypothetical protein
MHRLEIKQDQAFRHALTIKTDIIHPQACINNEYSNTNHSTTDMHRQGIKACQAFIHIYA